MYSTLIYLMIQLWIQADASVRNLLFHFVSCHEKYLSTYALCMSIKRSCAFDVPIYGSEAWRLTPSVCEKLNGVNSKMLSVITGKITHEEASVETRKIRARRLQWLGYILRMKERRQVKRSVHHMYVQRTRGGRSVNGHSDISKMGRIVSTCNPQGGVAHESV